MGGLVLAAWLNQDPQPRSGAGEPVVASAKPATVGAVGALEGIQPGVGADVMADATAGLTPEERAVMATDTMAASSSLGQWFGSLGGPTGEVAPPPAASGAEPPPAQSAAEPGPAEALAMATRHALALGQSQETAVAAPAAPPAAAAKVPQPQAPAVDSAVAAATSVAAAAPPAPTVTRTAVRAVPASPMATPIITPAKWISGGPTNADNRRGRYRGSVVVQFTVQPVGRASNCTVVRPSGNPEMDTLTCRIVTDRARFTPARDAAGRPVDSQAHATYVWGRKRR
jgi:protein TonB